MKLLILTCIFAAALFLGWYVSAAHLGPVIHTLFKPANFEAYLNYWFATFISIEAIIIFVYVVVLIKMIRSKTAA